ncbi:Uncharacterized protein FWK35_00020760 [Aphis craccivora]|uniref:Uncharacterized protein n=1 Tax=Aphis craccivora TaxID=307492 RepID=A0A6G0YFQ9_APHCR|nr:Uncharacterized protein FWK35_00020760 [Aphis craccivora]
MVAQRLMIDDSLIKGAFFYCSSLIATTCKKDVPCSSYFRGGFRCKSEYPWCIIKVKSKHFPTVFKKIKKNKKKKMTDKREFSRKTSFRPNRFFYMVVIQKPITVVNTWNFHQITFLRKHENLQRKDNDFSSNDFKYLSLFKNVDKFLIIQILTKIRQNHEYLQITLYLGK